MGFGYKAGYIQEKAMCIKKQRRNFKALCGLLTSLRPYKFVQGIELERNKKPEPEENLELIKG